MKSTTELLAVLTTAFLVGIASVLISQIAIFAPSRSLQTVVIIKVFFTSFNTVLLAGLALNYLRIYNDMNTPLSRSLLIFSLALMLYALTSSPLVHVLTGFEVISVGPYTFIPDLFVSFATLVILRESYR